MNGFLGNVNPVGHPLPVVELKWRVLKISVMEITTKTWNLPSPRQSARGESLDKSTRSLIGSLTTLRR